MNNSRLDSIIKKMLNDDDLFHLDLVLFNNAEFNELKRYVDNADRFNEIIDKKISDKQRDLKNIPTSHKNDYKIKEKREKLDESIKTLENLKKLYTIQSPLLNHIFEYLDRFGIPKINAGRSLLEELGEVIETQDRQVVDHYFLYKINKENSDWRKKTLKKLWQYVMELYDVQRELVEIAFIVRKLDALKIVWRVVND